jgi:serine/threonine-protein phosphatase PGAM5
MGPERFRAVDVNNGGISVFYINTRGEPMLQSLNMTSHLHVDGVYY